MPDKLKTNYIKQVVDKGLAKQEEAEKQWSDFEEEIKSQAVEKLTEEQLDAKAARMFSGFYRDLAKSDLVRFEGIFLFHSGKNNISEKRINNIMKAYQKNPQEMLAQGKIKIMDRPLKGEDGKIRKDSDGKEMWERNIPVAVEHAKNFNDGKPNQMVNPRYGKPLDPSVVTKEYQGLIISEKDEVKKFNMKMQGSENSKNSFVNTIDIPLGVPVEMFLANSGSIDKDTIRLVAKKRTTVRPIEKDINVLELVEKYYPEIKEIDIPQFEKTSAELRARKDYNTLVSVKGQMLEPNLIPKDDGTGGFRLMQDQKENENMFEQINDCRVKVPEDWLKTIDYGEYSEVKVFGSPWVMKAKKDEGSDLIGITASAIFPLNKHKPVERTNGIKEEDANGNGEVKDGEEFDEFNKME